MWQKATKQKLKLWASAFAYDAKGLVFFTPSLSGNFVFSRGFYKSSGKYKLVLTADYKRWIYFILILVLHGKLGILQDLAPTHLGL